MRGNTGAGPLKALDEKSLLEGGQRWRFVPLRNRLDNTSARPSALPTIDFETNLEDVRPDDTSFSHFAATLVTNTEVNITVTFTDYVDKVKPLSISLPLVFRNRKKLVALTLDSLQTSTDNAAEATVSIANCLTALSKDIGPKQFHHFFPQVVKEFALVFDRSKGASGVAKSKRGKAQAHSVFWDPEVSMVPLFAALAEITKNHLQYLASDPTGTLRSLLPLFSNSHYRVREMTAESCLGYLLRKTRDANVLKQLTEGVLDTCTVVSEDELGCKDAAIDGLGASLFEAVRLPSGRLHSRGRGVLSFALDHLEKAGQEGNGETDIVAETPEKMLAIVSRCYAGLSLHLKEISDVQNVCETLLDALRNAQREKNAFQAGNAAFLFRKSFQRGDRMLAVLDAPSLQKVLNALCELSQVFIDSPRVVYESLGALAAVIINSSESRSRHSASKALASFLSKVAGSSQASAVTVAMAISLRFRANLQGKISVATLTQCYSSLCEQLANLPVNGIDDGFSQKYNSRLALQTALLWLDNEDTRSGRAKSSPGFKVPSLETLLTRETSPRKDSESDLSQYFVQLREDLLYLSAVPVAEAHRVFGNLFGMENLSADLCGLVLTAFSFQFSEGCISISPELMEKVKLSVEKLLETRDTSFALTNVLKALGNFAQSFPKKMRDIFVSRSEDNYLRESVTKLYQNLSSPDQGLRKKSADLLFFFSSCWSSDGISEVNDTSDSEQDVDDLLKVRLAKLRVSLSGGEQELVGFYETLRHIIGTDKSLAKVESTLRLLRELGRILRTDAAINPIGVRASIHFSIGLLRTPFKIFWPPAAEIWGAATSRMQEFGMSVIVSHMRSAEDQLLREWSENGMYDDDNVLEYEEGNDSIEKDNEDGEAPNDSIRKYHKSPKNRIADSSSVSGNRSNTKKRPRAERGTFKGVIRTENISKRQRLRERDLLKRTWNVSEWKQFSNAQLSITFHHLRQLCKKESVNDSATYCTDNLTFVQELLKTLTKEPKHTLRYRSNIIESYLHLDPPLFSRRSGDAIATRFTTLLEKMGGLKCCENNKELETRMQNRLLADLTRSDAPLQVSAFRCLCISRTPSLKPHRESFIRLIEESTFREELAVLTETLFPNWEGFNEKLETTSEQELILDVLVRVCFSKMMGKRVKMDSRRSAVLSFIVSKLPDEVALPRITNLVLSPVANILEEQKMHVNPDGVLVGECKFPALNVQLGVLSSIESVLKNCKRSLPSLCWKRVAIGSFALLHNARTGAAGQNLRSRALRAIGDMCYIRPVETEFLVLPVVRTVRRAKFDVEGRTDGQGMPALLQFLSSVFKSDLYAAQKSIIEREEWTLTWSLRFLETETVHVPTVELSLAIAKQLVVLLRANTSMHDETPILEKGSKSFQFVLSLLASSLKGLLHRLVDDVMRSRSRQKFWVPIFESALDLAEKLTMIDSVETDVLLNLCEGLGTYLTGIKIVSKSCGGALRAMSAIASAVCMKTEGEDNTQADSGVRAVRIVALKLLPMFGDRRFIQESEPYRELCRLFSCLGLADFQVVSSILESMNSMEASRLDSPDLDRRIDGLNCITKAFKEALGDLENGENLEIKEPLLSAGGDIHLEPVPCGRDAVLALAYGCVAAVRFDDVAVRGTSSYALQLLAKWTAMSNVASAKLSRIEVFRLLLESMVSSRTGLLRREYCRGFADMVRHCESLSDDGKSPFSQMFGLLRGLANSQEQEADFFQNIVHMQAHRRGRALRQLENELLNPILKTELSDDQKHHARAVLASRFAFPLGLYIALESNDSGEKCQIRPSRHSESRESAQKDVLIWAVSLVSASAHWLEWSQYRSSVLGLMKKLKGSVDEDESEVLYKLVVGVAKAFPFAEDGESLNGVSRKRFLVDTLLPRMLSHVSGGGSESSLVETTDRTSFRNIGSRRGRAPPTIFRAPIAIAVGHLLTRLPESDVDVLISLLVTPLANALRSRMNATRDGAKKALTCVILTLGPKYLSYILRQVLAALSQGFRKDACVYVIHAILIGVKEHNLKLESEADTEKFSIDDASGLIASYLSDELEDGTSVITNDFQDPNASSNRQKQASARATRALECEELLAELVNFDKSAEVIVQHLWSLINKCSSSKLFSRAENALQKLVAGFSRNRSMNPRNAFILCYTLVSPSLDVEEGNLPSMRIENGTKLFGKKSASWNEGMRPDYRMTTFGFLLLGNVINKNMSSLSGYTSDARKLQAMLEPFLSFTGEVMLTKNDSLKLVALKAAQKLLKLPLTNRKRMADGMSEMIIEVLSQSGGVLTHTDELFNSCLRAGAILIHEVGGRDFRTVPRERVEALISIACNCIESGNVEARTAALALLKATVSRGFTIPAVYDAMEKVSRMAIRAQSSSLRASCTSVVIGFMVSFPLGSKRVRQQMEFFVRNLNYRLANGRLAALEALRAMIMKFPAEVLESESDYLFVAIAATVGRDTDSECRILASQVLEEIFKRVPAGRKIVDMLRMASKLLGAEKCWDTPAGTEVKVEYGQDAEVQLSGSLALSAACKSGRLTLSQLGVVGRVLVGSLQALEKDVSWETKYGLLQGIERVFEAQGEKVLKNESVEMKVYMKGLWEMMPELLVDKQQWIRLICARLIGKHLSRCGGREAKQEELGKKEYCLLWNGDGLVRELLKSFCLQLEANQVSEELAQQTLKNLVCIGHVVFRNGWIADVRSEVGVQGEGNRGIRWLLWRMSGMGMKVGESENDILRRGCALRFLLVTCKWWGGEFVRLNAEAYIGPIVKIMESKREEGSSDTGNGIGMAGLKELCSRLQEMIIEGIGGKEYWEVYQRLRGRREEGKEKRKRQMAFELAVNPERAARKRRKRAEKRKNSKKAVGRGTGEVEFEKDDIEKERGIRESLTADM